jgi:hypothetical protein
MLDIEDSTEEKKLGGMIRRWHDKYHLKGHNGRLGI